MLTVLGNRMKKLTPDPAITEEKLKQLDSKLAIYDFILGKQTYLAGEVNILPSQSYAIICSHSFIHLQELTLVLHTNPYTLTAPDSQVLPMFPALTHLHIVAPDMSPLLPTWITHAPRVTHLRISAHCLFGKFVDELPDAVGTPEYPFKRGFRPGITAGPPPAVRTYPTLARVVVQPGPRPASGPCGTNRFVFNSRTMQLDWIAARARELGVEMHVARTCAWTGDEWDEAIRTEWLRRVGGEGSRDWFCRVDEPADGSDGSEGDDGE